MLLARVQSLPEPSCYGPSPARYRAVSRSSARSFWRRHGPPMESLTFRRRSIREATYTGVTSPGCAASSGFLSLSTPSSARTSSTLFHVDATQVSISRGFPPAIASHVSRRALSLLLFSDAASQRRRCNSRDCCTHGVRTCQTGVTRNVAVDPLLMFTPSRSSSLDLGPLAGASSHGLQHAAGPGPKPPSVVVLALQSFKEPRSRRPLSRSFPSVGFSVQPSR
jgi:hypothetical protein